jgi:hypothetical protein
MSKTSDKTKEKLLSTMRQTKTGAGAADTSAAKAPKAAKKPVTRKKSVKRKKSSTKSAAKTKAVVKASVKASTAQASADPYQAGGRIWPD